MTTPGFTAESAVYVREMSYLSAMGPIQLLEAIVPAIPPGGGGCEQCQEVQPGVWQQECLTASGTTRVQRCQPTVLCHNCAADANSTTGFSEDCSLLGALHPVPFKRPCQPPPRGAPPPLEGSMGCGLPPECAGSSIVSTDTHCIGVIEFCKSNCQVPSTTHPGEMETKSGSWCPCGFCLGFW